MNEQNFLSLESEAGFTALFQFATVGILVISSGGRIELSNPCVEKLFGYEKVELSEQPVGRLIPEAFRKTHVHHVERGNVEIIKEHFDLYEFADDLREEVNGMLKQGQHIDFSYSGQLPIAQDKKVLSNISLNLLSNAIKYSGEQQMVHLDIDIGNQRVNIKVRDEGVGIPEEEQKNLFNKFYRAKMRQIYKAQDSV